MLNDWGRKELILEKILDLIFPPKCGLCGKIGTDICDECYKKIQQYQLKFNYKSDKCFCYKYEEIIRKLLIDYKFNDKSYLYKMFSKCIIKNKKIHNFIKSYDIIIPVPLHKKRKLQRGYNQVELIAKEIVKEIVSNQYYTRNTINKRIPKINKKQNEETQRNSIINKKRCIHVKNNILIKNKNTKPQSSKNFKQRIESVKGVYFVENKQEILNKKVLVFDDIYTTGATCNECKKVLICAGAKKVGILAIARDFFK